MTEAIRLIDQDLDVLGTEIERDGQVPALIAGGYAYRFSDDESLRRVLLGATYFLSESRSCFENLADFNRDFRGHYFGQIVADKDRYAAVTSMTTPSSWADDLRRIRHDLLHDRAPWLAFEVASRAKVWITFTKERVQDIFVALLKELRAFRLM